MKIKNWEIKQREYEKKIMFDVFEELEDVNGNKTKYFHTTLLKLSDALQYIAERI